MVVSCQLHTSLHCVHILVCVAMRYMPAGQQGWARCGVGVLGRLGTVGLLIREG